jgi:hypothetical protein
MANNDSNRVLKLLSGLKNKIQGAGQQGPVKTTADIDRVMRLGMSPRQQQLNHLWSWYRCEHYGARRQDWDGREVLDPIDHEAMATAGFIPPGFYDAGANLMPIKFRRPTAPYSLVRVIVDRFTSLLFSDKQHPYVLAEGDDDDNDYMGAMIEVSRLWPAMMLARQYGGAVGSVCVGFQFINGKPEVEVHDPRWCVPVFADRSSLRLKSVEKRYMYPQDERDPGTGKFATNWYWYRRIIDETSDTLFQPAPVGNGEEPDWQVAKAVEHGFGFCPCIWIQNTPVQDDIDGDSDCVGIYDMVEAIDALMSEANKGTIQNCDPTLLLVCDAEMNDIRKGSDNAIKLPAGSAEYLEISGTGPKMAMELVDTFRSYALEVAQCVITFADAQNKTATEIERQMLPMIAKADILREQYGHRGVLPLVDMMMQAARKLNEGGVNQETGDLERQVLLLPPRPVEQEDGTISLEPRKLGKGGLLQIQWPRYFQYTLADIGAAATAAGTALLGQLIDQDQAIRFAAEYFGVRNVSQLVVKMKKQQADAKDEQEQKSFSGIYGSFGGGGEDKPGEEEGA